jgi:hypothetical protein
MSRSSPPGSPIAGEGPDDDLSDEPARASDRPSLRRKLNLRLAAFMRWAHIYLSMFGLASILFFSVTGITLNHPDWFFGGAEHTVQAMGGVNVRWLRGEAPADGASSARSTATLDADGVDRLAVVEHLRAKHGVRGALAEFRTDDRECMVTFKGPGYSADAFIDRATGRYDLTETYHGFVAVINDLHKGRDTGKVWSVLIDASAVLMTFVSLTGLVLLFYIKRRRLSGLVTAVVGTIVVAAIVWLWVP